MHNSAPAFSVVEATLQLRMSVHLSVCHQNPFSLKIMPISHHLHLPSISHDAHRISAIMLISHHQIHQSLSLCLSAL